MFDSINQRVLDTKKLNEELKINNVKQAIYNSLAYTDVELIVLDAPGYKTTVRTNPIKD